MGLGGWAGACSSSNGRVRRRSWHGLLICLLDPSGMWVLQGHTSVHHRRRVLRLPMRPPAAGSHVHAHSHRCHWQHTDAMLLRRLRGHQALGHENVGVLVDSLHRQEDPNTNND